MDRAVCFSGWAVRLNPAAPDLAVPCRLAINPDRNDPDTVAWLDVCRLFRPELNDAQFEALVPEFIAVGNQLAARRSMH